jgi:hypothetical protein
VHIHLILCTYCESALLIISSCKYIYVVKTSVLASVYCTSLEFLTCWWPRCTMNCECTLQYCKCINLPLRAVVGTGPQGGWRDCSAHYPGVGLNRDVVLTFFFFRARSICSRWTAAWKTYCATLNTPPPLDVPTSTARCLHVHTTREILAAKGGTVCENVGR